MDESTVDPVEIVIEELHRGLEGVDVSSEMPPGDRPHRPARPHVQVSQTGGYSTPFMLFPQVSLLCCADTDANASRLATDCIDVLEDAAFEHPLLSAVSVSSKMRDQWTATGAARYEVILDLSVNV